MSEDLKEKLERTLMNVPEEYVPAVELYIDYLIYKEEKNAAEGIDEVKVTMTAEEYELAQTYAVEHNMTVSAALKESLLEKISN